MWCYTDCFNAPEHIRDELATHEICSLMDGQKSLGEIKHEILSEYEVEEADLDRSMTELVKDPTSIEALVS